MGEREPQCAVTNEREDTVRSAADVNEVSSMPCTTVWRMRCARPVEMFTVNRTVLRLNTHVPGRGVDCFAIVARQRPSPERFRD